MKKNKIVGRIIGLVIAIIVMFAAGIIGSKTGVIDQFKDIAGMIKIDSKVILKIVVVVAFLVGVNVLIQIIIGFIPQKGGRVSTFTTIVSSLVKYVVVLVGFCWILSAIGLDLNTVFAGVGIIALIIGFGAESLVADLVTGMFMLFENQFNVGDIIELDGYRGKVEFIGIRTTGVRDIGGNLKIINNSDIKNVLNRSERGSVTVTEIGISYRTDLKKVDKLMPGILDKIKADNPDMFINQIRYLGVENLSDSAVVLKFVADVEEENIFSGRRVLNKELKCAFDEACIEITYPKLDVYMRQ